MKFSLLISVLLPLSALAERPEIAGRPEHGPPPRSCNYGAVNECVARNQSVRDERRRSAEQTLPRVQALARQTEDLTRVRDKLAQQMAVNESEMSSLREEIEFGTRSREENSTLPFENFPSLESFFSLHPLQKSWSDRYPEERKQKLTVRLQEITREQARWKKDSDEFAGSFARLHSELQSVTNDYNNLVAQVGQHDAMCNGGCARSICPGY